MEALIRHRKWERDQSL